MPSPWSFTFEPLFVLLAAAAVALYVRAWRRSPGPAWRAWCFGAGVAIVVLALNSPLGTIAIEYLVLFHLLQNVMIGDWAPPLLLIGLTPQMRNAVAARGGHVARDDHPPGDRAPDLARRLVRRAPRRGLRRAVRNPVLLAIEHAFLIAIGLVFWWPVLCDVPRALATLTRIGYVFAAFVLSAFLGLALTFAPPVYDYYESRPERLWGITADQDQNLGGILMSTEQALVFLAAIVWLLVRLFHEEAEAEERLAAEQRAAGLREH